MGVVRQFWQREDRFWAAVFIAGLVLGLVVRIQLALLAHTPGHGDSAFYYTVATNLVDGRGLVVDYVVYFFNGLQPITHYSSDFWHPLASILLSLPMSWLGKSVFNALLASITFSLVPAVVAFLGAKQLSLTPAGSALAGILAFAAPFQVWVAVTTDANIFFGAFGALALYLAMRGLEKPHYFLIAGICSGLAHLTRQDGILVLLAVEAGLLLMAPIPLRQRLLWALGALCIHILVLSPLLVRNYTVFASVFPPGPASTMYLTKYEDFHAYGKPLDWASYRAALGLRRIFSLKLHAALENVSTLINFLDPLLALLTLAGLANLILVREQRPRLKWLFPALAFAGFEYGFYTLIASFSGPGSLPKALGILIPFLCLAIVGLIEYYVPSRTARTVLLSILILYSGVRGYQLNYRFNSYYNHMYQDYALVSRIIQEDAGEKPAGDIVVLTRDPWDVYEGTGFKTVMIPNNDLETIYAVAQHYQAEYILLPAPRKALDGIYTGTGPDPRFVFVAESPDQELKVFRIVAAP